MEDHQPGPGVWGVISGVTDGGPVCEIIENKCEGMIRIRGIKDDYYTLDEKENTQLFLGKEPRNLIKLGGEVVVDG